MSESLGAPNLIEFVELVETRVHPMVIKYPHLSKYEQLKGMVTKEELFVEMIGLADKFIHNAKVNKIWCKDSHCPSCTTCKRGQFQFIWKELKKKYNYYQEHGYIVSEEIPGDITPCSRCQKNIPYSIRGFSSDMCFICLEESTTPTNNSRWDRHPINPMCKICHINPKYQSQAICKTCHNIKSLLRKDPTKILIGNHHFIPKKCLDCGGVTRRTSIGKYMIRCEPCGKMHLEKSKTYRNRDKK